MAGAVVRQNVWWVCLRVGLGCGQHCTSRERNGTPALCKPTHAHMLGCSIPNLLELLFRDHPRAFSGAKSRVLGGPQHEGRKLTPCTNHPNSAGRGGSITGHCSAEARMTWNLELMIEIGLLARFTFKLLCSSSVLVKEIHDCCAA